MKKIRHLFDISDLTTEEIDGIIAVAEDIMAHREKYAHACDGKKIATLFFEPSTRTRLSFEAAMLELGGSTLGFASASASSTTKGESVMDTIRTVGAYADIIAMRHPLEGAALAASQRSIVPVINAGDGGHCHPTQTLADLLTIKTVTAGSITSSSASAATSNTGVPCTRSSTPSRAIPATASL